MTKPRITYAELKAQLDTFTPEQLAMPVIWAGDERGGYVHQCYVHEEDWIGSDHEDATARSEAVRSWDPSEVEEAAIITAKGTPWLLVD